MALPTTMRAIDHTGGGPLKMIEAALPQVGPTDILIKVAAAGLNRADLGQRHGSAYNGLAGASPYMGLEAAGEIAAVGAGVKRYKVGDKVCALLNGGGYAEYVATDEGSAMSIPEGLSMEEAAGLPETTMTVWVNSWDASELKPGESYLVHGGASGIGVTAIQMGKAYGCRVFATAGDDAKVALCKQLGAEIAVNYKTQDFEAVLKDAGGVDVVQDIVGGDYLQKNLNLLKMDGRITMVASLGGAETKIDLRSVMGKRARLTGSGLRVRTNSDKARIAAAVEKLVWPWIAEKKFRVVIDRVYPFEEAEAAQARMGANENAGKIILKM